MYKRQIQIYVSSSSSSSSSSFYTFQSFLWRNLWSIGVARIFSGVHFFPQKSWRPFLVIALKTQAKTTKWTTPTLQISLAQQKMPPKRLLLCLWGARTIFPGKLHLQIFFSALEGCRCAHCTHRLHLCCEDCCGYWQTLQLSTGFYLCAVVLNLLSYSYLTALWSWSQVSHLLIFCDTEEHTWAYLYTWAHTCIPEHTCIPRDVKL